MCQLTGENAREHNKKPIAVIHALFLADIIIELINPFREIAIGYALRPGAYVAHYAYVMKPLYAAHLILNYSVIALIVWKLTREWLHTPKGYRINLTMHLAILLVIIFLNAVFLFLTGDGFLKNLDVSTLLYGMAVAAFYFCTFWYAPKRVRDVLRERVIRSVNQGIVLFDFERRMVLWNARAQKLLPDARFEEGILLDDFTSLCGIPLDSRRDPDGISFQFYLQGSGTPHPMRCDYRMERNDSGQSLGHLLVLTDAMLETDLVTGFFGWDSFCQLVSDMPESYNYPAVVVMADVSGLSDINSSLGRSVGDSMMAELAELFRKFFAEDTSFVRGTDGLMIAIRRNCDEPTARTLTHEIRERYSGHFVFSIVKTDDSAPDILQTIAQAERSLRTRKLMDRHSRHSEVLNSLIRALQQCDPDTEAHVLRTQKMGSELGRRIGLSDASQAELALLCVMHDIGKIGIPLEILNKPGKLTPSEWRIMQEHVQKGAQIARSSEGLAGIADMVLHHHERWDGKGYPDGLSKESIPLLSRVISVVDSFDAMVSNRVYSPPMSRQEAMEELRRCAGTQFDPAIVAEFLEMLKETGLGETAGQPAPAVVHRPLQTHPEEPADTGNSVRTVRYGRYTLDPSMRILSANRDFEEMTGYTAEDIASGELTQLSLIPEEDRAEYLTTITAMLAVTDLVCCEHRLRCKDGSCINVLCSGRNYYSTGDRGNRSDITIVDVGKTEFTRRLTEQVRSDSSGLVARWEDKYRRDSLTGLMTKEAMRSDTEERLLTGNCRILFAMMDLDRFKEYNDRFGHPAGDAYLRLAANSILAEAGKDAIAGRIGGDEFAAVFFFPSDTKDEQMEAEARAFYERVSERVMADPNSLGLSMGAAFSDTALNTFNELYLAADNALYESKKGGRGKVSFYQ